MQLIRLLLFWAIASLYACSNGGHQRNEQQAVPNDSVPTNSKAQIFNNIHLHEAGGLQVAKAFLTLTNGSLLPSGNTVHINEPVFLNLVIKEGWMAENGKVSLGATQNITTEKGEPVLSSPDLFAGQSLIPESDAGILRLQATITKTREGITRFFVRFRVWDKKGNGEVTGRYVLFLKDLLPPKAVGSG